MTSPVVQSPHREVWIDLLDPSSGRSVKTWKFSNKAVITIGRAPGCDVEISDTFVSRDHAQLTLRGNHWVLVSTGRNGVVVNEQLVNDLAIPRELKFRLGATGPALHFRPAHQDAENQMTMCFDTSPIEVYAVDSAKLNHDVGAIADSDYFQTLQQKARHLREKRESN